MKTVELLEQVSVLGATLDIEGDDLIIDMPKGFPESLIDQLKEHKPEVLHYLRTHTCGPTTIDRPSCPCAEPFCDYDSGADPRSSTLGFPTAEQLLAWASGLAERDLTLATGVRFRENRLRPVKIVQVSRYAADHLKLIFQAKYWKTGQGWGRFGPEWWRERKQGAIHELLGLHAAMEEDRCQ